MTTVRLEDQYKRQKLRHIIFLFAIAILAVAIRLWNFDFDLLENNMPLTHDSYAKFKMSGYIFDGHYEPYYYKQPYFLIYSTGLLFRFLALFNQSGTIFLWKFVSTYMIFFSVLTAALTYLIAQTMFKDRNTALLSSLFLSVIPVSVIGSRYFKEDIPLMFFLCLAMYMLLLLLKNPSPKRYLMAGAAIGASIGVKYSAMGMIPFFVLAQVIIVFSTEKGRRMQTAFSPWFFGGLFLIAACFFLINPYILTNWSEFCQDFGSQAKYANQGHNDGTSISGWDGYWIFYLRHAIVPGVTLPLALAALLGLFIAPYKKNIPVLFVTAWALFFYLGLESSRSKPFPFFARYAHALFPFLCIFAAYYITRLYQKAEPNISLQVIVIIFGTMCAAVPLFKTSIINASLKNDTRSIASEWINSNLQRGSAIYLDDPYYSPRPSAELFKVNYRNKIHSRPVKALEKAGADYIVLNSFRTQRYDYCKRDTKKSKMITNYYKELLERSVLVKEIAPRFAWQQYGFHNPIIRIYRPLWNKEDHDNI